MYYFGDPVFKYCDNNNNKNNDVVVVIIVKKTHTGYRIERKYQCYCLPHMDNVQMKCFNET